MTFTFKSWRDGQWERIEAVADYPAGIDAIRLEVKVHKNGKPLYLNP